MTKLNFSWLKIAVIGGSLIFTGCSSIKPIQPWVKPYERQNLADPIMAFNKAPISDNYLHHVHQAREGARGAEGSAGGGCGCN